MLHIEMHSYIIIAGKITVSIDIWINPPAKSPGKLADEDLFTIILSTKLEGIMSNENALRSGSVEGSNVLFNIAKL